MPLRKTSLSIPDQVEGIYDLGYQFLISHKLIAKDFQSYDVTKSYNLTNPISAYAEQNSMRIPMKIPGTACVVNSSYTDTETGTKGLWHANPVVFREWCEQSVYTCKVGSKAGQRYFIGPNGWIYSITSNGASALAQVNTATYYPRVIYEDDQSLYIISNILVQANNNSTVYTSVFNKDSGTIVTSNTTNKQATTSVIYEDDQEIWLSPIVDGAAQGFTVSNKFMIFSKSTKTWRYSTYSFPQTYTFNVVNIGASFGVGKAQRINTGTVDTPVYKRVLYFPVYTTTAGLSVGTVDIDTGVIAGCDIDSRSSFMTALDISTSTAYPVNDLVVNVITLGSSQYLVVRKTIAIQSAIRTSGIALYKIDPTNYLKLSLVDSRDFNDLVYGIIAGPTPGTYMVIYTFGFQLLNWNPGINKFVESIYVQVPEGIKRANWDASNQIWIQSVTSINQGTDNLTIYIPTGTKYVKLEPQGSTVVDFTGTPVTKKFNLGVFDLSGTRLAQNVTLQSIGCTFLGGATSIVVASSATQDVEVSVTITTYGQARILAVDY